MGSEGMTAHFYFWKQFFFKSEHAEFLFEFRAILIFWRLIFLFTLRQIYLYQFTLLAPF